MNSILPAIPILAPDIDPKTKDADRSSRLITLSVIFAVLSAWWVDQLLGLEASSDAGYWIGVAGASAMLLLFLYPLRKRAKWLRNAGPTRIWFIFHMILGIGGPWLIMVHSGFRIGSMNAAVALFSMLIVATSGVIGRFIYVRVHLGLSGKKADLSQLRDKLSADHDGVSHRLAAVPAARDKLFEFEERALDVPQKKQAAPYRPLQIWWMARQLLQEVYHEIDEELRRRPVKPGVQRQQQRLKLRRSLRRQSARHVRHVKEVAQFAAWEHLFSLWHVLHIPFLYVMVICTLIHIGAVHIY